jgi:hypothetical protein
MAVAVATDAAPLFTRGPTRGARRGLLLAKWSCPPGPGPYCLVVVRRPQQPADPAVFYVSARLTG